ncbi:hypothetical protein ACOMDM_02270 [Serratia plymuthica]|uniref:hypothetical protein n=1 Tax=Serratia plymuthica TaxID=82996 RepID=UPI003BA00774
MQSSNDEPIEKRIVNYKEYIDFFRTDANMQGIWLFVATLGCWGVTHSVIRLAAMIILLFIFFYLINSNNKEKRPFQKIESEIESLITSQLEGDEKKARLYDLGQLSRYRKSVKKILKHSPIFLACYTFYMISFIYFLQGILGS